MRLLTEIFIVLAFLMINACTQKVESKVEKSKETTLQVYSVHELKLKPEVSSKDFETFVMSEIAPLYRQMKGQDLLLVKGDRGIRTNKYAIILTFESVEDRNRIYPPDIGFSEEFKKVFEGKDFLWKKFDSFATGFDGTTNTDYVRVLH